MSATANGSIEPPPAKGRLRTILPRAAEIVLAIVAIACVVVFATQDFGSVFRFFYSPVAVLILVVVLVEYLIVKSSDRSRLYRMEIDRMHEREHEQVGRIRRALAEIEQAIERCRQLPNPSDPAATEAAANDVKESLRRTEKILRQPQ
jgi:hypothetical protein